MDYHYLSYDAFLEFLNSVDPKFNDDYVIIINLRLRCFGILAINDESKFIVMLSGSVSKSSPSFLDDLEKIKCDDIHFLKNSIIEQCNKSNRHVRILR